MRWPITSAVSRLWTHEFHIDYQAVGHRIRQHPVALVLTLGALLRLLTYYRNRPFWLDEGMLEGNVVGMPVLDFAAGLKSGQLAPLGFLIVERAIAAFLSSRNSFLRFPPLAAGMGALFLFARLAPRVLSRRAALVALVLFAFSDDLVYYSSEFKPYSFDVLFGIAVTLGAARALGQEPTTRQAVWLTLLVVTAPWFSFVSAFVIASCGIVLFLDALIAGRHRTSLVWLMIGLVWLGSFLVSHEASEALLGPSSSMMYRFWDFAFLPLRYPPTIDGLLKSIALLLEVFVNPLNVLSPGRTRLGVFLPAILLIAGILSMAMRRPKTFVLLVTPIALAIGAAITRRYPFHGRLILELVPALFFLIAEGTEAVAQFFPGRTGFAYKALLVALLVFPCWDAYQRSWTSWDRDFNPHGDLHDNVFIDIPTKTPSRATTTRQTH